MFAARRDNSGDAVPRAARGRWFLMNNSPKTAVISRVCLLAGALLSLCSCQSSGPATAIRKVQTYHLKPSQPQTPERMIRSESRGRFWGAVAGSERANRLGNYFTVHWRTDDTKTPAKVRFDYHQAHSQSKLFSQEIDVPAPSRHNVTEFRVIGQPYFVHGRVVAWRVQVQQGGAVIGEETSFLWD